MSAGSAEIGYLCYHGHYCFHADPDEGGECGSKRVGTITLTFDDSEAPADWTEIVADAQASLAEKYETWRNCDCEGSAAYVKEADDLLVGIEKRAEAAEAKILELIAYGEKRYQQWQDVVAERDAWKAKAEGREARYDFLSDGSDDGEPPSAAEFKRVRKIVAERRADEDYMCPNCVTPWKCNGPHLDAECPRCFEPVTHEDDHLRGDKDVNCWYECPGDDRPTS